MGTVTINASRFTGRIAGYDLDIPREACAHIAEAAIYLEPNTSFANSTVIWADEALTVIPPIGYYALDMLSRYWDGIIMSDTLDCYVDSIMIKLRFGATAELACAEIVENDFWFPYSDATWSNAISLGTTYYYLASPPGVNLAASGFYADSTGIVREWQTSPQGFLSTDTCV